MIITFRESDGRIAERYEVEPTGVTETDTIQVKVTKGPYKGKLFWLPKPQETKNMFPCVFCSLTENSRYAPCFCRDGESALRGRCCTTCGKTPAEIANSLSRRIYKVFQALRSSKSDESQ